MFLYAGKRVYSDTKQHIRKVYEMIHNIKNNVADKWGAGIALKTWVNILGLWGILYKYIQGVKKR